MGPKSVEICESVVKLFTYICFKYISYMYSVELDDRQSSIVRDMTYSDPLKQDVNLNNTQKCSSSSIPADARDTSPQRPNRLWGPYTPYTMGTGCCLPEDKTPRA
jgi:hypothetical protein